MTRILFFSSQFPISSFIFAWVFGKDIYIYDDARVCIELVGYGVLGGVACSCVNMWYLLEHKDLIPGAGNICEY